MKRLFFALLAFFIFTGTVTAAPFYDVFLGKVRDTYSVDPEFRKTLNQSSIYESDFSGNYNEWGQTSYTNSTYTIEDGTINIKGVAYWTSATYERNSIFRNGMIEFDCLDNTGWCQAHIRESDSDNFAYVYLRPASSDLRVAIKTTTLDSVVDTGVFPDYSHTRGYKVRIKFFENLLKIIVIDNVTNEIVANETVIKSNFDGLTGTINALGSAVSSDTIYDNYSAKKIDSFKNVIFLGDSITAGYGLDSVYDAYPYLIEKEYMQESISVTNLARSGETIDGLDDDIDGTTDTFLSDNYVNEAENVIYMMIGTNDIANQGQTGAAAWVEYESLIDNILSDGRFELNILTVSPRSDNATYSGYIRDLNLLIKENADSKGYNVIDTYALLVDPTDDDALQSQYDQDGRHLTEAAYRAIFNKINKTFNLPSIQNAYPKIEVKETITLTPISSATCDSSTAGAMYYDSDDNHFYGCNGTTWIQLDN